MRTSLMVWPPRLTGSGIHTVIFFRPAGTSLIVATYVASKVLLSEANSGKAAMARRRRTSLRIMRRSLSD